MSDVPLDFKSLMASARPQLAEPLPRDPASRAARADAQGYTHHAFHGTDANINAFDPKRVDIGTHVGTQEQANRRVNAKINQGSQRGANVLPLRVRLGKSLVMPDVGDWNNSARTLRSLFYDAPKLNPDFRGSPELRKRMEEAIRDSDNHYNDQDDTYWENSPKNRAHLDWANKHLQDLGYGSIKYHNVIENAHGDKAALLPEHQARVEKINEELRALADEVGKRRPPHPDTLNLSEPGEWARAYRNHTNWYPDDAMTPEEAEREHALIEEHRAINNDPTKRGDPHSYIVLNPAHIRSRHAMFDPAKAEEHDILAKRGGFEAWPLHRASGGRAGLYANIHAKQERIAHGSGEHMRKPGSKGAPTAEAFRESERTAKAAGGALNDGTRIHKNPTAAQLQKLTEKSPSKYMRGMRHGDDHYWWDGSKAIHAQGAEAAGIPYDYKSRLESTITPFGYFRIGHDEHGVPASLQDYTWGYAQGGQAGGAGGGEYRLQMQHRLAKAEGGPAENAHPVTIFHGGDDFDEINPARFGTGEPGGIRPLGKGLYGGLAVHPGDLEPALGLARRYAKYGKKPTIHAFQAHLPENIKNLNYGGEGGPPMWGRTGGDGWEAEALPWGVPGKRAKEISVLKPEMLRRVGKWPADTPTHKILADLSGDRAKKAEGGGMSPQGPRGPQGPKLHSGPIHSPVAGRTDHLPMHVASGSYVIPADIISAMGEGNTIAGFKQMRRMFGGVPYGKSENPYDHRGGPYGQSGDPYNQGAGPYGEKIQGRAQGGETTGVVPIVAAGGEYVLTPDEVTFAGGGDLDRGHRVLDQFVKRMRAKTVKTLAKLPGPKKD